MWTCLKRYIVCKLIWYQTVDTILWRFSCPCMLYTMVSNKIAAVRFQRFANHWRIWESTGHQTNVLLFSCVVTPNGSWTRIKQMSMSNDVYTKTDFLVIMPPKIGLLNKARLNQTLTVMGWKPHLLKTATIAIAIVRCMLFIHSFVSEMITWSPEVKGENYVCICYLYFIKYTSRVDRWLLNS